MEHSTVDVDAALQAPAHATEAEVRAWYHECNKANVELQAKVSKLQEMVNRLSADGHTAEHRTRDCKVCQHTLWQATHDAAVTELQRRRAIGDSGGGSALRYVYVYLQAYSSWQHFSFLTQQSIFLVF